MIKENITNKKICMYEQSPSLDELKNSQEMESEEPESGEKETEEKKEMTGEEKIEELSKKQAMKESKDHFEQQYKKIPDFIKKNEEKITDLLERYRNKEKISPETIASELKLKPDDVLNADEILKGLEYANDKYPENSLEAFKSFIEDKKNPAVLLIDAEKKYDDGESWYHTTEEGAKRLEEIKNSYRPEEENAE